MYHKIFSLFLFVSLANIGFACKSAGVKCTEGTITKTLSVNFTCCQGAYGNSWKLNSKDCYGNDTSSSCAIPTSIPGYTLPSGCSFYCSG